MRIHSASLVPVHASTAKTIAFTYMLAALTSVAACGGSDNNASSPTLIAPTPRLLQQGTFPLLAPEDDGAYFQLATMTDPASGLWEATVDWRNAANTLFMWVANGACSAEQFARPECPLEPNCPCQFSIRSETATPKPRVLTIPNASGGTRTLIVLNLGPGEEAATYRVMLTPNSIVANSSSAAGAPAPVLSSGRKVMRRDRSQ